MRSSLQPKESLTRKCINCLSTKPREQFRHGNQCRQCLNIWTKDYRKRNKAKIKTVKATNYRDNRSSVLSQQAEYRDRSKSKIRARSERYRITHRPERAALEADRQSRKRASVVGSDKKAIQDVYLLARTAKRLACYLCQRSTKIGERHVEHIVPLSKGGTHTSGNLGISCIDCNLSKHAKLPAQVGLLL